MTAEAQERPPEQAGEFRRAWGSHRIMEHHVIPPAGDPEFKGSVIIEWPAAASRGPVSRVLACYTVTVRAEEDGTIIPCAGFTLRAPATGFIVADVAVFLGKDGEILRDAGRIARESDGIPAVFPFLVAEMRIAGQTA